MFTFIILLLQTYAVANSKDARCSYSTFYSLLVSLCNIKPLHSIIQQYQSVNNHKENLL